MELYITNEDGKKLHCCNWYPDGPIRGVLFICHGWAEHLEYYDHVAKELNKYGVLAVGHDHVGHGKSGGVPVHVDQFQEYTRDVWKHVDMLLEDYGNLPFFLLGHSMGGTIAIKAMEERPRFFKGVLLVAPLVRTDFLHIFSRNVAKFIAPVFPYIYSLPLDIATLTRDPTMVKRLQEDPLRWNRGFRSRWTVCMMNVLRELETSFVAIECPLYLVHGNDDRLCNLNGSQILFTRARSLDKTFRIVEGAYHGLLVELPDTTNGIIREMGEWISRRLIDSPRMCVTLVTRMTADGRSIYQEERAGSDHAEERTYEIPAGPYEQTSERGMQAPSQFALTEDLCPVDQQMPKRDEEPLKHPIPLELALLSGMVSSPYRPLPMGLPIELQAVLGMMQGGHPSGSDHFHVKSLPAELAAFSGYESHPALGLSGEIAAFAGPRADPTRSPNMTLTGELAAFAGQHANFTPKMNLTGEMAALTGLQTTTKPKQSAKNTLPVEIEAFTGQHYDDPQSRKKETEH